MIDLAAFDDQADERWHTDPRDKDPRGEDARQLEFLTQARQQCPAVDIVAVPNAGRRTKWEVAKRKREGMKAGALDLFCTWQGGGVAFLEFKNGTEDPDDNQRDRLNLYTRQGHNCGVFRQAGTALDFLRRCGAPFLTQGPL